MSDDEFAVAFEPHAATRAEPVAAAARPVPRALSEPQWQRPSATSRLPAAARIVLFVGAQPAQPMREALADDGVRCVWARDLSAGIVASRAAWFDAAVIDASVLRGGIGMVLTQLRAVLRCPLIVTAAQCDEIDEIVALECGASAYLSQPLPPRRLHTHLRAQMRNAVSDARDERFNAMAVCPTHVSASWRLDSVRGELWVGERRALLTGVQSALMQCLIEARGAVVARARLGAALPTKYPPAGRAVDVYVHRLRKRLSEHGVDSRAIRSIAGHGYLLDVSQRHRSAA